MWFFKLMVFLFASLFFLSLTVLFRIITLGLRNSITDRMVALLTSFWGKTMLLILNIVVIVQNSALIISDEQKLFVSNHQSYLDIIIAASIRPILFVAKKEVKEWTLLGWMANYGGTIFIDRDSFRGGKSATNELTKSLKRKNSIQIFPEATSTDGSHILPFKPMLFSCAIESNTAIQPMTIVYRSIDDEAFSQKNRDIVCWYGMMEFPPHFIRLLKIKSIQAEVIFHSTISIDKNDTPRSLAEKSYAMVSSV